MRGTGTERQSRRVSESSDSGRVLHLCYIGNYFEPSDGLVPGVMVSVEECGAKQVVEVLLEGAHRGTHLTSIPHCWTTLVILVPWVEHLVGILTYEGVTLHSETQLCDGHCYG